MAKNKISEWSATAANNTDVGGIDIAEGCAPSGINNAIREVMAQVKDMITGADGDSQVVGGNLTVNGTSTLTGAVSAPAGVTGNLTGNVTGNVTGTSGNVSGTVAVANGGTGLTTLTANNVILGNGTSAPSFVAPSTSGNVLTSNGTTWTSVAPATFSPTVLLGTLTTTSGATQVLSGLNLTGYKSLKIIIDRVSHNYTVSTTSLTLESLSVSGVFVNTSFAYGVIEIFLEQNGTFTSIISDSTTSGTTVATIGTQGRAGESGITTATTSLTFAWAIGAASSFDGGTIKVYGIK